MASTNYVKDYSIIHIYVDREKKKKKNTYVFCESIKEKSFMTIN